MTPLSPVRIAMWSGPRNISTALMRSWGNRADTAVCDEPLYAFYLKSTGLPHPGAEEVIRSHEPDWRKVVRRLTGEAPDGRRIFYQKHMAHHLLPEIDRAWIGELTNCFLIRDPQEMLTSLMKIIPEPTVADTGLPQQFEIFQQECERRSRPPPVLDSRDVLDDPAGMLRRLCFEVGVEFSEDMLEWPPGRRETDGVWAPYWYGEVETSTSFRPYRAKPDEVPDSLAPVLEECRDYYRRLAEHKLEV